MVLRNKKVLFLGDSITQGAMATETRFIYHQVIKTDLKLSEAKNYGLSGTRIARQTVPSIDHVWDLDYNLRAELLVQDDADLVFVFGGTNDFGHGDAEMGTIEDTSVFTFYGALKTLYGKLVSRYGKDKIIILTPMHRVNDDSVFGEGNKLRAGHVLLEYVKAIKEVANEFNLKVIDLFNYQELNPNIEENKKYFADGLHPTNEGHKLLAQIIEKELEKL